jgi:hypothetical protein
MSFELAPYTFTQFFIEKSRAKCFLCLRASSLQAPPACTCYTIRSRGKLGKEFRQIIVQASNNYREKQYKLKTVQIESIIYWRKSQQGALHPETEGRVCCNHGNACCGLFHVNAPAGQGLMYQQQGYK